MTAAKVIKVDGCLGCPFVRIDVGQWDTGWSCRGSGVCGHGRPPVDIPPKCPLRRGPVHVEAKS